MRIVGRAIVLLLAALVIVTGPVAAAAIDSSTQACEHLDGSRSINGTVTLASVGAGQSLTLVLEGESADGVTSPLMTFGPIALDAATLTYSYSFANVAVENIVRYRVMAAGSDVPVATVDVEIECVPPAVPESPSALLMLITGGSVVVTTLVWHLRPSRARIGR